MLNLTVAIPAIGCWYIQILKVLSFNFFCLRNVSYICNVANCLGFFFVCVCVRVKLIYCSMAWHQTLLPQCNLYEFIGTWMYSQSWDLISRAFFFPFNFMTMTYLHLEERYLTCLPSLQLYLPFWISNFHPVVFVPIWCCNTIVRKQMSEISNSN